MRSSVSVSVVDEIECLCRWWMRSSVSVSVVDEIECLCVGGG